MLFLVTKLADNNYENKTIEIKWLLSCIKLTNIALLWSFSPA